MSLQNQALQRLADWPDRRADYLKISSSNVMVSNFCRCTFSSFSQMSVKPSPSPSALTLTSALVSITTSESLLATFDNNNNDVRTLGSNDKKVEKEKKGRENIEWNLNAVNMANPGSSHGRVPVWPYLTKFGLIFKG